MLWRHTAYCVKLSGEDLWRYLNKIESVGLRTCPHCHNDKHFAWAELASHHGGKTAGDGTSLISYEYIGHVTIEVTWYPDFGKDASVKKRFGSNEKMMTMMMMMTGEWRRCTWLLSTASTGATTVVEHVSCVGDALWVVGLSLTRLVRVHVHTVCIAHRHAHRQLPATRREHNFSHRIHHENTVERIPNKGWSNRFF